MVSTGPIDIAFQAQMREQGLVSALMPGTAQETRGRVDAEVRVSGTWDNPHLSGDAQLTDAGCYIPRAGIRLKDIRVETRFSEDQVRVTSFRATSGPGSLEGTGSIRLRGWRISGYEGTLTGERFQTIFLPDIRAEASPTLSITGTAEEIRVRGGIRIPSLYLLGAPTEGVVRPSADVVIVDAPAKEKVPKLPLGLDARIRLELGDQVFVRTQGLDARLSGGVDVRAGGADDITVQGKLSVAKGGYKAYGVDLQIARGNIVFTGPPERPSLDILATKQVNEIVAGVEVTGTAQAPIVTLYSQPSMPDTDKLAYIVLGRPLSGDSARSAVLMRAASVLLSRGKAEGLQEKLRGLFGLDVLDVSPDFAARTGNEAITTPSNLGPLGTRAPPGTRSPTSAAASGTGDIAGTVVTVGRYLSPKLYISLGRSLFTGENLVALRYTLTKHLEIETRTGTESGADIFYKIQFE
jgi:translocation and assembly module TamB